jgi:hypothetical protein
MYRCDIILEKVPGAGEFGSQIRLIFIRVQNIHLLAKNTISAT